MTSTLATDGDPRGTTKEQQREHNAHDANETWHAEKIRFTGRAMVLLALRGEPFSIEDVRTAAAIPDGIETRWLGTLVARFVRRARILEVLTTDKATRKAARRQKVTILRLAPNGGERRARTWLHRNPACPTDPPAARLEPPPFTVSTSGGATEATFPPASTITSELPLWPGDGRRVPDVGASGGAESRGGCQSAEQRDRS